MQTRSEINHLISKTYVKSPGRYFKSIEPVIHYLPSSPQAVVKMDKFTGFVNEYSSAYYK